ncbi:MAG: ribonuclease E/G [Gammaproteobacteria bacterium]|nr:ribonuclease E/G [Gammaproteobacteria bacterium]
MLFDTDDAFEQASQFVSQVMPQFTSRLKRYDSDVPLFNRYQIENQIESAFQREVRLPSGGSIVIDQTEALVSIDINSARATRGADIEETALNTNLEAADEICRQLRLRDIGGLIVIDFIDMSTAKNQRKVENQMQEALQIDRARVQIGRISRFGLLEMSRQRLRQSLVESSGIVCPRCSGLGSIRDVESCALAVVRLIEEEALKDTSSEIRAFVPVSVSSFLLNEKRNVVSEIETRCDVRVVIIPSVDMETPHYKVERIRSQDDDAPEASYEIEVESEPDPSHATTKAPPPEQAAVKAVAPSGPPPEKQEKEAAEAQPAPKKIPRTPRKPKKNVQKKGLLARLMDSLLGTGAQETKRKQPAAKAAKTDTSAATAGDTGKSGQGQDQAKKGSGSSNRRRRRGGQGKRKPAQEQGTQQDQKSRQDQDKKDQDKKDQDKKVDRNEDQASEGEQQSSRQRDDNRGRRSQQKRSSEREQSTEEPRHEEKAEPAKDDASSGQRSDDKRNQGNRRQRGQQRRRSHEVTEEAATAESTTEATTDESSASPEPESTPAKERAANAPESTAETATSESTPTATQPEPAKKTPTETSRVDHPLHPGTRRERSSIEAGQACRGAGPVGCGATAEAAGTRAAGANDRRRTSQYPRPSCQRSSHRGRRR